MRFEDKDDGEYRIHAGCLELRAGQGFLAAVIVDRPTESALGRLEVYRDTQLSGGHRWLTCDLALRHALAHGANIVTAERFKIMNGATAPALVSADPPALSRHA